MPGRVARDAPTAAPGTGSRWFALVRMGTGTRTDVTLRRLAASLAAAALVLGGALVGVPAAAAPGGAAVVAAAPDQPRFSVSVHSSTALTRPGGTFTYDVQTAKEGNFELATDQFVAVQLSWPDVLEIGDVEGCEYVIPGGGNVALADATVSGPDDYCLKYAGVPLTVKLESGLAIDTEDLRSPGDLIARVPSLITLTSTSGSFDETDLAGDPESASAPIVYAALYHASVDSPPTSWVPGDRLGVLFGVSFPDISDGGGALDWSSATTSWDLTWPTEVSLDPSVPLPFGTECDNGDPIEQGHCVITITQEAECDCGGDIGFQSGAQPQAAVVAPDACTDYCEYSARRVLPHQGWVPARRGGHRLRRFSGERHVRGRRRR